MKRNSTTLFLDTINATTPLPWVDNAPDFSGFTEPTLSVLVTAWNEFVASGETLEVIPDPEPVVVELPPDWDGLYQTLLGSTVYQHLVGLALQYNAVDSALDKTIAAIGYGDKKPDSTVAYDAFQSAVNLLLYALGLVQQTLSESHSLEIRQALDDNGFGSITLN